MTRTSADLVKVGDQLAVVMHGGKPGPPRKVIEIDHTDTLGSANPYFRLEPQDDRDLPFVPLGWISYRMLTLQLP